jgi:hypothetical protein
MQRTICRRIMGNKFWQQIQTTRQNWNNQASSSQVIFEVPDLLHLGTHISTPRRRDSISETSSTGQLFKVLPVGYMLIILKCRFNLLLLQFPRS